MQARQAISHAFGLYGAFLAACLAAIPATGLADTIIFGKPIGRLVLHDLNDGMSRAADPTSPHAADLPGRPKVGGLCPTFTDKLWAFPAGITEHCITPAVTAALKSCGQAVGGSGAGVLANAASCMQSLADQADFSQPLDRALNAVSGSVACMARGVVSASSDSPQEIRAAIAVIDGIEATYNEYTALSKIATGLAQAGPGAIPDFLSIDISGNDGFDGSVSAGDWAIELSTIADDPEAYARSRTSDKFKTKLTEALARAVFDPARSLDELRDWASPDRPLGRTDEMLRRCELADAQLIWAQRRLVLEKAVQDQRISMEHYRRQTMCRLYEGAQDFNAASVWERERMLLGMHTPNVGTIPTPFKKWLRFSNQLATALEKYEEFRAQEAEFQAKYDDALRDLTPLLNKVAELKALARANVKICTGSFVTSRSGGLSDFDDPEAELEYRVQLLKGELLGHRCSIEMANRFVAGIRAEIANPYQKWSDFLSRAQWAVQSGEACSAGRFKTLWEDMERSVAESFGSMQAMQACLNTDRQRRIVGDIFGLSMALEELDGLIADAAAQVEACDKAAAPRTIAKAREILASTPCKNRTGGRTATLNGLEELLALPECGVAEAAGGYIVRITGSGYIPHWAGGSSFTSGYHDILIEMASDATQADLLARLREIRANYLGDPCKIDIPAIPGLVKTPVAWETGPFVEAIAGPVARLRNMPDPELEDTWNVVSDYDEATGKWTGPNVTELRRGACKPGIRQ